jgi:putative hydrolase
MRGDCHTHTDASDGSASIAEMAAAAAELGHDWLVITDHSPRLTIANGLSPARLRRQLDQIDAINAALDSTGFRLLTGIEVDILADGSLDQEPELLARLDVVVGSIHSGLRDDRAVMTRRMKTALANPHLDILGHCTGRKLAVKTDAAHARSGWRPPSAFDAKAVFAAAVRHDKAIEINCRPDRRDPPTALLTVAAQVPGLRFAIDTDAHATDQLAWQALGCERAEGVGLTADRIVNAWSAEELLAWTASHA